MKNIFTLSLLLVAVMVVSCSGMRKFDRVETTSVERYSIVYKDNKCGLYDIQADSLVTAIKYDALRYGRTASEQGMYPLEVPPTSLWRLCSLCDNQQRNNRIKH